jgi:iron complex outermembrane receptor protein
MKRFLFLSLLLLTSYTYSQQVKLSGTLIDQKDDPIPYANVVLENTNYGTTTNQGGEFELKARPGTYTLVVSSLGYGRFSQKVVLDKTTNLGTITLTNQTQSLNEVAINSHNINRFSDKRTDYVARMPLENLENPQVYSVITKELMQEQMVTDIGQTVRNAVGVVPIIYPSGGLGTTFRGFNVGINARNGMETTSGRSGIDLANVERIEILKGPSGTLFGGNVSSFGGVVNLVTKKPMEVIKNEISYTTGSYNLNRITADINTPLNKEKTVLFRLNTALNKEKSFLDYGFYDAYLIAPSFLFKASDRLSFTLDTELLNVNSTRNLYNRYAPESGITSPEDLKLDYDKALFHNDADAQTSSTKIFAEAKYQLAENWTSSTLFSFVGEDVDHSYQYYATWLSPTIAQRESGNWNSIYNNYTNLQENINGEFSTGNIKHKVLIGASYRMFQSRSEASQSGVIDTIDVSTDFQVLRKEDIDPYLVSNSWPGWNAVNSSTLSAYATDVIDWTDRLSTMFSLRVDHFDREAKAGAEGFQQTALSPKLGLVYQVVKDRVSVFGNYMNGFQNQAPRTQPDGSQFVLDPIYAEQLEAGVKAEIFDKKLSATASFYHITIDNAIRTNADGFTAQDGEQVSKGIDIEVIANPFPGLNIIAGYAYNDNRIIKSSDESIEGNKATDSPENVANFWASYTFQNKLHGLGFGIGGNHVGQSYMFSDNVFSIPAYTVYNASLFYNQPSWRIGLKINNLTDEKYWTFWGVRQPPANLAANVTFRF